MATLKNMYPFLGIFLFLIMASFFVFSLYTKTGIVGNTITTLATFDSKEVETTPVNLQIGVYSIYPSFAIDDKYNIVDRYTRLQREIRLLHSDILLKCEGSVDFENCIQEMLNQEKYRNWFMGKDCETPEETIFYDVTELFSSCLQSSDSDCWCHEELSYPSGIKEGEYYIQLYQDEGEVQFTLEDTDLSLNVLGVQLETTGIPLENEEFVMRFENGHVIGGFYALPPASSISIHKKDASTLSVESEEVFSTSTKEQCTLPQDIYKFCMVDVTTIPVAEDFDNEYPSFQDVEEAYDSSGECITYKEYSGIIDDILEEKYNDIYGECSTEETEEAYYDEVTTVTVYDEKEGKTVEKPLIFEFALLFQSNLMERIHNMQKN